MHKQVRNDEEEKEIKCKGEDKYNEEYYYRILNQNRYILLYSDIEPCSADMTVSKIKAMNFLDSKKPITIEINSGGGEAHSGITIMNAMEQSKAPITTIISGEACSMAAFISIVAQHRKIYANSYWMMHPLAEGQMDYLSYIKDRTAFLIQLERIMQSYLKKYTKLSSADIRHTMSGELWLNAEKAKAKGVVDEIIHQK